MRVLVNNIVEDLEMRVSQNNSEDHALGFILSHGVLPQWNEEHEMYEMTQDEYEYWSDMIAEELSEIWERRRIVREMGAHKGYDN